jgi:V/A-type H+-transporting ATPase subunit I
LESPVEELGQLETTECLAGLLPSQQFDQGVEQVGELGAVIEHFGLTDNRYACLVFCIKEDTNHLQKLLRSVDFEQTGFDHLSGTVTELIEEYNEKLALTKEQAKDHREALGSLAQNYLNLQMLADHYSNLLSREQAKVEAPATEQVVLLEGWVKKKDYSRLEAIVSDFSASSLSLVEASEDEEVPVEIENKGAIRPFEVVTRLYGMPQHFEVDPTVFLAPFFALFFALCLTDAGYGLVLIVAIALFVKKMQGDTKLMWMLGICSVVTVGAGALTGGWFGDAVQQLDIGWLNTARAKMIWFDPLEKPMMFFGLSLILGYIQILAGLVIAFCHNIKQKDYTAAVCDQLTWLVMLNSVVIFGASKAGALPEVVGAVFGKVALVPAITIFLFSQREGGWGGRLGMGAYNLFSAIFYMGDVLSYLRLMALGMVTAGLGMAINVIAKIAYDVPFVGFVLMIIVLIGGHGFNLAISGLSAFVHTLRLQYVEFFPKFIAGGGKLFEPLNKRYEHVYIKKI